MQKSIDIARMIDRHPEKKIDDKLRESNLHNIFSPIFSLSHPLSTKNKIVAFIIFAYDNTSTWLDIKKDRIQNKIKILSSLDADYTSQLFDEIIKNENETVNNVITEYLIDQTDWRWHSIMTSFELHANLMRFINQPIQTTKSIDKANKDGSIDTLNQDYNIDIITKVNQQKPQLLEDAIQARKTGEKLLEEIKRDFVQMDNAVQQDFGFSITDEKKIDTMLWRDFIRHKVLPLKNKKPA